MSGAQPPERPAEEPARTADDPLETTHSGPETEEAPLGGTAAGKAASAVIRSLAHTARSFILYDAANERIRNFLEDLRRRVDAFLHDFGALAIETRPFELVYNSEVVYSDHDREHSLAFRLYRDGVRRLTIQPGLEWEELVTLVGVLSVRYKGLRQQEDDIVTLLWRANLVHIEMAAVEGLVADEDEGDAGGAGGAASALQELAQAAPYSFDYPWPNLTARAQAEYRPIPAEMLARAQREDDDGLDRDCVLLVGEMLAGLGDRIDQVAIDDVFPTLREVRNFLVIEGHLDALVAVAQLIIDHGPDDQASRRLLLAACVDPDTLRKLLISLPPATSEPPEALVRLLNLVPGEHLAALLDLFVDKGKNAPGVVGPLIAALAPGHGDQLLERIRRAELAVAIPLFRLLAGADATAAAAAAAELLAAGELELQLEALRFAEHAPYGPRLGRALVGALGAESGDVRRRALTILVRQRERRAFDPLVDRLRRGGSDVEDSEAAAIGDALARLEPERARPLFSDWIRPPGLFGRMVAGQSILRWAAVAGLARLPGGKSEELLSWLASKGGDELVRHCQWALGELAKPGGRRE
jgi:hypothetical protein